MWNSTGGPSIHPWLREVVDDNSAHASFTSPDQKIMQSGTVLSVILLHVHLETLEPARNHRDCFKDLQGHLL